MNGQPETAERAGLEHLLGRLRIVESRIRELVARRRATDPAPDDPFRGLYLNEDAVDRLLGGERARSALADRSEIEDCERRAAAAERAGARVRLRELARTFDLGPLDVDLLLVALAVELDPRFEQLFGYLNDDVTRRRPSVSTALALCGEPVTSRTARARLVDGPLIRGRLLTVDEPERPFPGRSLRVPDRVVGHLLGNDAPDPALAAALADVPVVEWGDPTQLATALRRGVALAYLREPASGSGRVLAVRALQVVGRRAVVLDLQRVAGDPDPMAVAAAALREARLGAAGLVAGPVQSETLRPRLIEALSAPDTPVLLVGDGPWDPSWSARHPLVVDVPASTPSERTALWNAGLVAAGTDVTGIDTAAATEQFLMRPEQVIRAAQAAVQQAQLEPDPRAGTRHLQAGARAENGSALQRLARRVEPGVGWDDLVVSGATHTALREVALRARHRERVLGEWRMRPGGGRGMGVSALFAGDSGTGKTMSAEVIAGDLGLDLYVVDLATVVDKYVGETEKNLERIFTAAAGVNGVLLFDEADAVFGKRSEVKDAHDRYANVESAYLLQRMESFDGLVVLTTNLRANIDEAFTRRLDVLVDFPLPDAEQRRALWHKCLGQRVPRAEDVDLDFCAAAFELAGGAIRSAAVTAAYLAAADGGVVAMRHVITAIHREYRKLGRLSLEHEFGRYYSMVG